ncbi:MAG: HIT family protein [Pelagibacteraceae bacterium TMED201]|nr:MAG: HIT family protein [Pelagibacteraceae bacterium TMED201]|tara:strand:- start:518 stop:919 length:402 start_codon:yes stop_codon:yes gene_type:complete
MNDPNNPCIFCSSKTQKIILENKLTYSTYDSYPVSKFHSLIIPKRHIGSYFDLSNEEIIDINKIIFKMKSEIENKDKSVMGFNIGSNSGKVAGQTIMHCHIHLIPRRKDDVVNPQGGVRAVIPSKQHYIRKNK